ncbi:MAG: GNAT family N-acetyltransferase [Anaerolineaceae bacterium]
MAQTQSNLHVVRYRDASAFSMLRPFWNSILKSTPVDDPFLLWEWQSTWWENYGSNTPLWLLVAWENENPVGFFPLMETCYAKHGYKARGLCVVGKWDIDHCGIIVPENRPDILQAFGSFLHGCRREWDILRLNNCLECGQDLEPFFQSFSPHWHTTMKLNELSHLYFPLEADWEKCQQRLPAKLKRKVKSKFMSLKYDHSYSFVHLLGNEITENYLQDFLGIGLQGHFPYLYKSKADHLFHRSLVSRLDGECQTSLNLLYIDGVPTAYHYGFIYNNKYYAWRTAFISQFLEYAPGHIILNETLEYFCNQGLTEFDFLRGDARYKREWTNETRLYFDWQIVRRWSLCALFFVRFVNWRIKLRDFIHLKGQPATSTG